MEGETGDVGVVSMSQQLLRDPRIVQLNRLKPAIVAPGPGDLVRLPPVRKAFIYQRLSTHEQRKKSLWSLEMQDALREQAKADGYRDDQIIVERRDLGISGTKSREERPGLDKRLPLYASETSDYATISFLCCYDLCYATKYKVTLHRSDPDKSGSDCGRALDCQALILGVR